MIEVEPITEALGCAAPVGICREFNRIVTDSRVAQAGDLFIALAGPTHDGHDFINKAISNGVSGIVCSREWLAGHSPHRAVHYFAVENTFSSLRKIAGLWRAQFRGTVVAVAGSAGKTTTKELLAAILGRRFNVHKTTSSQNGDVGIPMTLLSIQNAHDIAIVEIGIDRIGAMSDHERLVQPNYSIVTSIGEEHLAGLHDIKTVATEETLLLVQTLKRQGKAFLCVDDPWLEGFANSNQSSGLMTYSVSGRERATASFTGLYNAATDTLTLASLGHEQALPCPLPGLHNATNLMGAVAVALQLGCSIDDIKIGLAHFSPPEHRSRIEMLPNGATVLIDFYNANPSSMRAALETIGQIAQKQYATKIILCLADMLELGADELLLHEKIAQYFPRIPQCHAFLYGERMKALAAVLWRDHPQVNTEHYSDLDKLALAVQTALARSSVLLLKGSRGMALERLWQRLK